MRKKQVEIVKLEFRNTRKTYISWAASLAAVLFALLYFYTFMQNEAMQALAHAKLYDMPPAVLAMFGMSAIPDLTKITNFFGMVAQYVLLAFSIFCAQCGVNMLLREEVDGSIEYLYAQPVSRGNIFIFKFVTNIVQISAIAIVLFIISFIAYLLFSTTSFTRTLYETGVLWASVIYAELVIFSIGVILSALLRNNKTGVSVALGIVFFSFITAMLSTISESLSWLKNFSPLDWLKFPRLLDEGLTPIMLIVGIVIIITCNGVAYWRYSRKDFLV
jgi:ABC-2 type transport system permease protein